MSVRREDRGDLTIDRLANQHDPVEVVLFDGLEVGSDGDAAREPQRHDYHELIWVRSGSGHHLLDGVEVPVLPSADRHRARPGPRLPARPRRQRRGRALRR